MTTRRTGVVLLVVVASLSVALPMSNGDVESRRQFVTEYARALDALEHRSSNSTVEVRVDRGHAPARISYIIKGLAQQRVAEYEPDSAPESGVRRVESMSPERAFYITSDSSTGAYILRGFGDAVRSDVALRMRVDNWMARPMTHIRGFAMRQVIEEQGIHLELVESVMTEGESTLKIEFFAPADDQSAFYAPDAEVPPDATEKGKHVTVWLLPERGWVVKEYEIVSDAMWAFGGREQELTYHVTLDYSNPPSTDPLFPSRIDYRLTNRLSDGEIIEDVQTVHIEDVTFGNVTDEQFTLSHFGLPELASGQSDHRTLLWIIVVNAVLFAGCAAYLVRARRHARQS